MGQCTLKFNRIAILDKKSDPDHVDVDYLSVVWLVNDNDPIQQTIPLKSNGSPYLNTNSIVDYVETSVECKDTDMVTAVYTINNLGSTDWGDQARAATQITQEVAKGAAQIYLQALKHALGTLGALTGAPPVAALIAWALEKVPDDFLNQIAGLVDVAFEDVITPIVAAISEEVSNLLGHPNCNGEIMHDFYNFVPGDDTVTASSKQYTGPQKNSSCGAPPRTQIDVSGLRTLDNYVSPLGPIIQESANDMAMREFRQRAEIAAQQGYVGAFPNFYYASYGPANVGGTIFIKPECGEWRDVPLSDLNNPPLDNFAARMRATQDYATRNGFVGGFPNFFQADRLTSIGVGPLLATQRSQSVLHPSAQAANPFSRLNPVQQQALMQGLGYAGHPRIETVCGTVLIKQGCAIRRDLSMAELGNPSINDIGARFRATQDYATRNGFVGGFPNFYDRASIFNTVCNTILLSSNAADWKDVLLSLGPA